MKTPAAEVDVTEGLLRRLLVEQHPELADLPLALVANGWDNVIIRIGDDLVARLPRREVAVPLILHEREWLPRIAERVSIPIPTPIRVGAPSDLFPWDWTIAKWMRGDLAAEIPCAARPALATDLARFLRELHVPSPADAPVNPVRGVPLAMRSEAVARRWETGLIPRVVEARAAWRSALMVRPWEGPPLWLHGDLHPANILVRDGVLSGVIDFGDMTGGDPATDLATAWLTFGPDGRAEFRGALDYDADTWARAKGWALSMATAMLAGSADAPLTRRIGMDCLEQVLSEG